MGRLPSFDEDDVIRDTRAWDSRGQHSVEENIRPLSDIEDDVSHGQEREKTSGIEDVPSITDEKEQKRNGTELQEMSAKDRATGDTTTAGHSGDTDDEDPSVTSALLDKNNKKS